MFFMAKLQRLGRQFLSLKWMIILLVAVLLFAWQMCASYQRSADIEKKLQNKHNKNFQL
jgi:hypothetical protein